MHRGCSNIIRVTCLTFVLCLCVAAFSPNSQAAVVDAIWNGGTGDWGTDSMWNTGVVPNNGADTYNVFIDGGKTTVNSLVTVNTTATIGTLSIDNGDTLGIQNSIGFTISGGTITNNGILTMPATGWASYLQINGATTITGSGKIEMGNSSFIIGSNLSDVLTNETGHTISGSGYLGDGKLSLINKGLIDANLASATLTVRPNSAGVVNQNIMQASNGGTLNLTGGTFTNTGHVIQALDGSIVQLGRHAMNTTIIDGTFATQGSGIIRVDDDSSVTLQGTVANNGTLELNTTAWGAGLWINGSTMITGSGTLRMSQTNPNGYHGSINGVNSTDILTNDTGHTISGAGYFGGNSGNLGLINKGLIDANIPNDVLRVYPSSAGAINQGVMQASNGGTLNLTGGTFTNSLGVIQALDDSTVQLLGNSTIVGGIIETTNKGVFQVPSGNNTVEGNITNMGILDVKNSTLTVNGNVIGDGNTLVSNGARLTVNSLVQNSLTIGPGSIVTICPLSGGPLSSDPISQVPEPSMIAMLLGLGVMGMFDYVWRRHRN